MLHTVFFLIGACQFMLLDDSLLIVLHTSSHYKTILCSSLHGLRVKIIARILVLHKPTFTLELFKLLDRNFIDTRIVFVDYWIEIDLRLDDMIKRLLVAFTFGISLL